MPEQTERNQQPASITRDGKQMKLAFKNPVPVKDREGWLDTSSFTLGNSAKTWHAAKAVFDAEFKVLTLTFKTEIGNYRLWF